MVHLRSRIWGAAVTPVVREAAPVVANVMKTFGQFILFFCIACSILIVAYFVSGEVPEHVLKSAVMVLGLVPMVFGLIVVADMVRLTYAKPMEVVYPTVEAFEDREPI